MNENKLSFVGWINRYYGPLWSYFDFNANEIWSEYYEYLDEKENE